MKFIADRSILLPALQRAARVAPRTNTIPILGHCLVEARKTRLSITATDMERAIVVSLDAQVETPGSTTVDARMLSQFVAGLADGSQVSLALADPFLVVRAGRANARFPVLPPVDFPTLPELTNAPEIALEGKAFAAQLASVAHAQSNEETRYYLNGIYLHRRGGRELVAVATDGHMLARTVLSVAEDLPAFTGAIVPRETVSELAALAEDAGTLTVAIGETRLRAEAGDIVLTTKLVDGTYPDYERILPGPDVKPGFDVGREELVRAIKRVGVFATDKGKSRPIKLTPDGRTVALLGRAEDQGEISDEIDARTTDGTPHIGLNARFVLAALDALGGRDLQVRYADSGSPVAFTDPTDPTRLQIVMAMRV